MNLGELAAWQSLGIGIELNEVSIVGNEVPVGEFGDPYSLSRGGGPEVARSRELWRITRLWRGNRVVALQHATKLHRTRRRRIVGVCLVETRVLQSLRKCLDQRVGESTNIEMSVIAHVFGLCHISQVVNHLP